MNRNSDTQNGIVVAILFSLAAIIMSICSLARNNERVLGFDYLGVIVGILALMVTFLVVFQIWQTIASREQLKNLDERIEKETQHAIHINLYHVFLFQGINAHTNRNFLSAIDYLLRSLDCANKCNLDFQSKDKVIQKIKSITDDTNSRESLQINSTDCHTYESILKSCNHDDVENIITILKSRKNQNTPSQITNWTNLASNTTTNSFNWNNGNNG